MRGKIRAENRSKIDLDLGSEIVVALKYKGATNQLIIVRKSSDLSNVSLWLNLSLEIFRILQQVSELSYESLSLIDFTSLWEFFSFRCLWKICPGLGRVRVWKFLQYRNVEESASV